MPEISYIHRHIGTATHKFIHVYSSDFFLSLSAEFLAAAPPIGSGSERSAGRGGCLPAKPRKLNKTNNNIAAKKLNGDLVEDDTLLDTGSEPEGEHLGPW